MKHLFISDTGIVVFQCENILSEKNKAIQAIKNHLLVHFRDTVIHKINYIPKQHFRINPSNKLASMCVRKRSVTYYVKI